MAPRATNSLRRTRRLAGAATAALAALVVSTIGGPAPEARAVGPPLTTADVTQLVSRVVTYAKKRSKRPLTVAVVDVEGNSLGVYHMNGSAGSRAIALSKASTGAYFSSDFGSFTTRTAAFIIQDHFPPGVRFAPGGPLYGVQFSSIATSDVNSIYYPRPQDVAPGTVHDGLPEGAQARVRGDLGGIGIYKNGKRVGGLGVDDGSNKTTITIPTSAIVNENKGYRLTFRKMEKGRAMERIVHAAAAGFLPDRSRRARRITVDGFRLPFRKPPNVRKRAPRPLGPGDGVWDADYPLRDAAPIPSRFAALTLDPPPGSSREAQSFDVTVPTAFPIRASTDGNLTEADVRRILWQGVQRANITRAAIRRPIGLAMQCWVSVVDTNGEVLGVVRTPDATLFSYDVSVQKARTTVLFSDSKVAWSCRAVGQHAQGFYPAGQQQGHTGPLYQVQDGLTVALLTGALGAPAPGVVRNGTTIFPGGVPLYTNGRLVGGVGVSGDGVDQDDIVADFASIGFQAPKSIRCDKVVAAGLKASLQRTLTRLGNLAPAGPLADPVAQEGLEFFLARLKNARGRLSRQKLTVSPPYVKHPRHPGPVTIR